MYRNRLNSALGQIDKRNDKEYILNRVNYYNRLTPQHYQPKWADELTELGKQKMRKQKVYFFDTFEYTRWFQ